MKVVKEKTNGRQARGFVVGLPHGESAKLTKEVLGVGPFGFAQDKLLGVG